MAVVLVADDDAAVREVLTTVLTRRGHQVVPVPDGQAALARLTGGGPVPDLAFVDWAMPHGGVTLLRALRDERPALVIVLMSGSEWGLEERAGSPDADADAFLRKPFDLAEVDRVIQAALAGLQFHDRRQYPRRFVTWRAEVRHAAGTAHGLTRDLSLGGAQVRLPAGVLSARPGDAVEGVLYGPGGRAVHLSSKVVYHRDAAAGEDRLGLAFIDPEATTLATLF